MLSRTLPERISSPTTTMPARSVMHGDTSAGVAGSESARRCAGGGGERPVIAAQTQAGVLAVWQAELVLVAMP